MSYHKRSHFISLKKWVIDDVVRKCLFLLLIFSSTVILGQSFKRQDHNSRNVSAIRTFSNVFFEGRNVDFYLNHSDIDENSKRFWKGELSLSADSEIYHQIWDSIIKVTNAETRPFYDEVYKSIVAFYLKELQDSIGAKWSRAWMDSYSPNPFNNSDIFIFPQLMAFRERIHEENLNYFLVQFAEINPCRFLKLTEWSSLDFGYKINVQWIMWFMMPSYYPNTLEIVDNQSRNGQEMEDYLYKECTEYYPLWMKVAQKQELIKTSPKVKTGHPTLYNKIFIDSLNGQPISYYMDHQGIDDDSKLLYSGKKYFFELDSGYIRMWDSVLTGVNTETKPFYIFLAFRCLDIAYEYSVRKFNSVGDDYFDYSFSVCDNFVALFKKDPCAYFGYIENKEFKTNIKDATDAIYPCWYPFDEYSVYEQFGKMEGRCSVYHEKFGQVIELFDERVWKSNNSPSNQY